MIKTNKNSTQKSENKWFEDPKNDNNKKKSCIV